MEYHKLVRDRIPDILKQKNQLATYHTATQEEYWQKLKEKLQEEVDEFTRDETPEELADILEVIDALIAYKTWSMTEIQDTKEKKKVDRGGFADRIILDTT